MSKKLDIFISIVLILKNSNIIIFEDYLRNVQQYLQQHYNDYEIIIIDQNIPLIEISKRNSLLEIIPSIRWIKLAFFDRQQTVIFFLRKNDDNCF